MRHLRRSTPTLSFVTSVSMFAILLLGLFGIPIRGHAIDTAVTQAIWKMVYGVTDTQIDSAAWLAADDDGDGISNGAEIAAGTDPFAAGSTVKISNMTVVSGSLNLSFPTIPFKQYFIQSTSTIGASGSWMPLGSTLTPADGVKGDGTTKTLSVAQAANTFYRVVVQDLDSDGDGISDWSEMKAGYDPTKAMTDGRTADGAAVNGALVSLNQVTVTAMKANATQPPDALTAPADVGSITVSRGISKLGSLTAAPITVPLQRSGSAGEGTDYDALPASVSFTTGVSQVVLSVNPKYNGTRRTNVTAIVKALAGTGYTLGSASSSSVVINPAGITNGTGLTGAYYQGASSTYSNASNFGGASVSYTYTRTNSTTGTASISASGFSASNQLKLQFSNGPIGGGTYDIVYTIATSPVPGSTFTVPITGTNLPVSGNGMCILNPPVLTRSDAGIDFSAYSLSTNPTGWGQGSNGTYGTTYPILTNNSQNLAGAKYCVRWTGQVLPQYSETYSFDFRSDDGARVWVNGVLLIDKWVGQGVTDWVNTINLQANVLYDIQIDHYNGGGGGEAHLYWWSPSQTKQIIPASRLFPPPITALKLTALTNSLYAFGYVGTQFSFSVVAPNIGGTVTYALDANSGPLPPGLALDQNTGVISGSPSLAGTYNVAVNAVNVAAVPSGTVTGSSIVNFTIYPSGSVTREIVATNGTFTADGTIPTLDDETNYTASSARRLRGYIVPPKTGNYYFWLAANNTAELWISNDSEYVNRVRRATVTASSGKKTWNTSTTQQTQWLSLVAGQKYYFDVLHNTPGGADDYVSLGWCQDDLGTIPATASAPNATGATPLIPNGGTVLQGYALSGTAPSYIFQPYDYPSAGTTTGTLYAGSLGPQGSSSSKASGSVNIRVDPSNTYATLHFNYGNLTSPRTAYHLHTDAFATHPAGEIIYDIDAEDSFHPEDKTADGGYIWHFGVVGSFTSAAQILSAIQQGKVYLNVHTVNFPAGEIRGNLVLVNGSQIPPDPAAYPEPTATDSATNDTHAARFLNQATFGASPPDVTYVKTNGFAGWVTDQLSKPASHSSSDVINNVTADINSPYASYLFTNAWWKYSINGPDQLRQRLAFALSEIMVISWNNDTGPLANNSRLLADYYDQLVDYCLPTSGLTDSGNFRGILKAVTLTPAMGKYLDMLGNQKGDDSLGRHPNENYSREIMQLFSVGLNRMWDDGRFVLDSNANLIPTYNQTSILGVAALLTGWNYAQSNQANGRSPTNFGPSADYLNPMVLVSSQHELKAKLLLNNVVTPAATGLTPRVSITGIAIGNPCTVTTSTVHGLTTGDSVTIAGVTGVSGGAFVTAINATFPVIVTGASTFSVPVQCTTAAGTVGTVTGPTVTAATFGTSGLAAIAGSQADSTGTTQPHPYDQYGLTELDVAINNIVNNDNVPPYICRQLIQRLVTSNPSAGYVYRVVQKFKDDGSAQHMRGNLAAVVKQILLDGEARSSTSALATASFGKQREPMLRLTGAARAFPAASYTGTYTQLTGVNASKLRIVTTKPNDFNSGFSVSLDFRGNYTTTNPPNPYTNPTSTTYSIGATLGIASTTTDIASIDVTSPARVHTVQPHGLANGNAVTITGVTNGNFSAVLTTQRTITVVDPNTFDVVGVNCTGAPSSVASAKMFSNPCKITTLQAHGLTTGDTVTMSGVSGGTFSTPISGTPFTVTVVDPTSFTIATNCTAASTANTGSIVGANTLDVNATGMTNTSYTEPSGSNLLMVNTSGPQTNVTVPGTTVNVTSIVPGAAPATDPCVVTTSAAHNLVNGGLVTITSVTDGVFTAAVNGTFTPTVTGTNTFTIPVSCTTAAATGNTTKLIRSKVYLMFLSQTTAGGAAQPADGVFEVQTTPTSSSFTILTADTPGTARGGSVIVPKIGTSYSPITSNTIIQFNTSSNHNLVVGQNVWVDVPIVGTPVTDAEYTVATITDEDHFTTPYLPANSNGGTYAKPSGSNNGITFYPLVAPPTGRSGSVTINQSTFDVRSTDSALSESPLNSPTVFNFYFPNYRFPGSLSNANLDSPEFQLSTDTNLSNVTNSLTNMFIGTSGGNTNVNGLSSFNSGGGSIVMDIGAYLTVAKTSDMGIPALRDELASLLVGVPLEPSTKITIQNFVANTTNFPLNSTPTNQQMRDRVRAIIHLIITSAEYAVQK